MKREAKPVSAATRAMLDAMETDAAAAPEGDKLDRAKTMVAQLRDAEMEKARLEELLTKKNIEINDLLWTKIPTLMDEVMLDDLTISADGNKPPYTIRVEDYYKASIPGERAEEAYAYLRAHRAEDLIKTDFKISFGLGEAKATERFQRSLEKAGVQFVSSRGVPWNTLTAWFREEYKKKPLPKKAMDVLGATVKRVAKVVKQKEKK